MSITLTKDQQHAKDEILKFLGQRDTHVMVLKGYAGTGKTTLVKDILEHIPKMNALARIVNPNHKNREVILTATTHKAAEALSVATNAEVDTIHAHLQLSLRTDYSTGEQFLVAKRHASAVHDQIIFVDEASYIDEQLLRFILNRTHNCKIVLMGDPTQLSPVGCSNTPAFSSNFPEVELTQIVRQDDHNPIKDLCEKLRAYIKGETKVFPKIEAKGTYIQKVLRHDFDDMVLKEFTRKDWKSSDSRMLAWTNAEVNRYNHALHKKVTGRPALAKGDYAVNNHYLKGDGTSKPIKTDATVLITHVEPEERYGYSGFLIHTDKSEGLFQVAHWPDYQKALDEAVQLESNEVTQEILNTWCDLRPSYCCTVNKSQGSTFDRVFIDLDDISRSRDKNQLARMIYVAISRARHSAIIAGDL